MCPGGPNHCRVGQTGSHSYFCRLNVVRCFQVLDVLLWLVVMLLSCELHALVRRRVAMMSIMSLLPSYTHKKNKNKVDNQTVLVCNTLLCFSIRELNILVCNIIYIFINKK
jgi:hypothetical protein